MAVTTRARVITSAEGASAGSGPRSSLVRILVWWERI